MKPPAHELTQLIVAYWHSQAVYVAAELGIADELIAGPKHADDLARAVGANPDALFRLLRALASLGCREAGRRLTMAASNA